MAVEHRDPVALERVPNVDGVVIVAGEHDAAGDGEVDGVDAEEDRLLGVLGHLAVGSEVEEATGRVVGSRSDGVAARVVLDRVDVRVVALEVLDVVAGPHVPNE